MQSFLGIEYGRGCLKTAIPDGPALGPGAIQKMFPDAKWEMVIAEPFDAIACARDRFGENFRIQREIYQATDALYKTGQGNRHIMIGGDHSTNFGHFAAVADNTDGDLCLVYVDAHFDIHTPESGIAEASGAPHGSNVRALLGTGDERWLSLAKKVPSLKPENLFYLGTRSFEPSEENFVNTSHIFNRYPAELKTPDDWKRAVNRIREQINGRPFVLSFDFDAIDPKYFRDILVPAGGGISPECAKFILSGFRDAAAFEFVEYSPSGDEMSADLARELISIVFNG